MFDVVRPQSDWISVDAGVRPFSGMAAPGIVVQGVWIVRGQLAAGWRSGCRIAGVWVNADACRDYVLLKVGEQVYVVVLAMGPVA